MSCCGGLSISTSLGVQESCCGALSVPGGLGVVMFGLDGYGCLIEALGRRVVKRCSCNSPMGRSGSHDPRLVLGSPILPAFTWVPLAPVGSAMPHGEAGNMTRNRSLGPLSPVLRSG